MTTSGEPTPRQAKCARCGHTAPTCEKCGRATRFLGGMIDGEWYCHTFTTGVETRSCYTEALWEGARWR